MKKVILFFVIVFFVFGITFSMPVSNISISLGPSISNQSLGLTSAVDMTLSFWVAHVESHFSFNTSFANNTLLFTSIDASQLFKYVDFNWDVFRIEYGATNTHSSQFYTPWDIGTSNNDSSIYNSWTIGPYLPGWTFMIKGEAGNNSLTFAYDRGGYFARFNGLFYIDSFWYANTFLLTGGLNKIFLTGGISNGAYTVGVSGNYGAFSNSLMAFSSPVDIFPNVVHQVPSSFLWLSAYKDQNFYALMGMTENEIRFQGLFSFDMMDGNGQLSFSGYYVKNGFIPEYGSSESFQFTKTIFQNGSFFLDASWNGSVNIWSGLTWRF